MLTRPMTVSRKISGIVALLCLLSIGLTASGILSADRINANLERIVQRESQAQRLANRLLLELILLQRTEKNIVITQDPQNIQSYIQKADDHLARIADLRQRLRPLLDPVDLERLDASVEQFRRYRELFEQITSASIAGNDDLARDLSRNQGFAAIEEGLLGISQHTDALMDQAALDARQLYETSRFSMILTAAIGVGLSIALVVVVLRSMLRSINRSVLDIAEASNQVSTASDEVASASTTLAEGAQEQSSSIEQINATVEESTAAISENTRNAAEATNIATQTHNAAQEGSQKATELRSAMQGITEASRNIARIIKTIDEIAFQTNLLALNAAVEAARAGEHGQGFAVVADEVKNLAGRSARAAGETTDIIETTIEQIGRGNQVAEQASDTFEDILDHARKTSELIAEITGSMQEQTQGLNQISTAISQADSTTQQSASVSEQSAAAAEQLNAQARSMRDSIQTIARMFGVRTSLGKIADSTGHKSRTMALKSAHTHEGDHDYTEY